jgi:hypothetical protein
VRVSLVPATTEPSAVSIRMSERFRPSSTKYGPSVISGFATQSTALPVAPLLVPAAAAAVAPAAVNATPVRPSRVSARRLLSTRPTGVSSESMDPPFVRGERDQAKL